VIEYSTPRAVRALSTAARFATPESMIATWQSSDVREGVAALAGAAAAVESLTVGRLGGIVT
jgi:hypothetical protein